MDLSDFPSIAPSAVLSVVTDFPSIAAPAAAVTLLSNFTCQERDPDNPDQEFPKVITANDPVLPFDTVVNSLLVLYCANAISGLHTAACEQPKCNIIQRSPNAACNGSSVLAKNNETTTLYDFAYLLL